jgi:predicted alpha/beta hydrolase
VTAESSTTAETVAEPERFELTSERGLPISVSSWGDWASAEGVVLVVPAIATRARHYNGFARWLVGQGFVAVTFDFSGYGDSLRGPLKDSPVDILDWARDARTVLDWVAEKDATLPVTWVGHSLGGQLLGLAGDRGVTQSIFVATGVGSGWKSPWQTAVPGMVMFFLVGPIAQKLCGYYPGRRLKFFGNLPSGVMSQWRTWVAYPRYILGERPWLAPRYASITSPITAVSFTDDVVMSKAALRMLLSFYSGARKMHFRFSPKSLGVGSIGHMGPFRAASASIWGTVFLPFLAKRRGPPADN